MFGIVLFFVGAVLFVNGMALLGKADSRGTVPINLFVGFLTLLINLYFMFTLPFGEPLSYYYAGTGLLFSFTYLWGAMNNSFGYDGRAFGWYCLFVAISAMPTAYISLASDWRFAAFWASWGALWFIYFLVLSLDKTSPQFLRFTGYATVVVAIVTCWFPGYLIMIDKF